MHFFFRTTDTITYQFICYSGVGAIGTGAHYLVLLMLVQVWNIDAVFASTFGCIVGAIINYFLNYHFTFFSKKGHFEAMGKFFVVAIGGIFFNGLLMFCAVDFLNIQYFGAQLTVTAILLISKFLVNRVWTF